ncbi:hypothetical protein JQX13_11160 [Archangium violaceum]|uniref:hypothetical protein n=1 Tax=Archangium violaceum TaxID=83451 RepID=UPI00193B75D8|nr:hypothetical protein [Archangium violaceum]QRK10589.1 hypothetical protein JQX13_11160 [Archangium violaceum]
MGAGAQDVEAEVKLNPPSESEFVEIARKDLDTHGHASLTDKQEELLRDIGKETSYCALVAKCVASTCGIQTLTTDLQELRNEMGSGKYTDVDQKLEVTLQRCWCALDPLAQERVAFVAALGEPEVPETWLPRRLVLQGGLRVWRLLDRVGATERDTSPEGIRLRIHRLVAAWVRNHTEIDVTEEVLTT